MRAQVESEAWPVWPASAAQVAEWPRLAEAHGSLGHDLAPREASGEPAGRRLCHLVFDIGLSGKPLYTKRADSFSAAVSASSGDALATANGARAERQRRSGRGR